uniref:CNH domain-containing protein n=2 Tax=Acrobeloides nanus TaxID=290746 RepID=A0A914DKF3_9BILA
MYDAYAQNDVASKLPLEVSALASSNNKNILYVGSKAGHLLTCFPQTEGKRGFEFQICKSFEKKAITDLQVIESQELILCLTDSQLNVHSIDDQFSLIYSLNKYKPISTFASHVQQENNLLLVTIACKRRLYVFKWLINEFDEVPISFNPLYLSDNPHLITWCGDSSLVFAVKNDYFYVQIFKDENETETDELGKIRILFNADSRPPDSPLVVDVLDKKVLGLCRDNFIMFINYTGEISREVQSVRFSEPPLALIYDPPYFVGILQKNIIEIRSLTNSILIQKVQLKSQQKFTHLCQVTRGTVFAASPTNIWELSSKPLLKSNIEFLEKNKNFDLAIELAQLCDDLDPNYLVLIKRKAAANLFSQKRFPECFNIHLELKTDVLLVLHFFPHIIPEKYLAKLSLYKNEELDSFENPADFAENEKKQAILALTDYLSAMRTEYARIISLHYKDRKENRKENLLQTQELKRLESILELIDTALLKCYLQSKPMLVSSLLRLPDNSCIIGEAEQALRDKKKYPEMFILYERKKMHRKALDLLKTEARNEDSELFGPERTVQYLQTLGPDNLPLIFEYSQWVLAENFEMGVQIFATNDVEQVKKWDREKVLSFLAKECVAAIIPYLEHLIYEWHEKRPKFHEALLEQYIAKVTVLMKDYIHALSDNENMIKGGAEEGELGIYRRKLMKFLEFSNEYNPQKILYLLNNNILEERAIVYGRLKMHEEALAIYTSVLLDYKAAERHCNKYYDPKDPINSQVFLTLFKAYTNPIDPSKAEIQTHLAKTPKPNVNEALRILRCHAARINTIEAIPLIPLDTPLNMVWNALEAVLEATKNKASSLTMHLALSKLALEKCQTHLKKLQSAKIVIDYTVECSMCKKKIANSAFVRDSNGSIVHFFCYNKAKQSSESSS